VVTGREEGIVEYNNILVTREENIGIITLNQPKSLNALRRVTMEELAAACDELERDDGVRCIIITGAGERAFAAGADINELRTIANSSEGAEFAAWGQSILFKIETLSKPVIAAINGYALGGGCELAMACDIRVAAEHAKLGQPEVNLGIIPGWGGTQRLPRLVGKGRAKWLILSGDTILAQEALRIGLVDFVVARDDLINAAKGLARRIAANAPLAISWAKRSINVGSETDLVTACAYEASQFGLICGTEDRIEGTSAFLEKRPPQFKGH
jgi:enoyl-CoA hydratase